MDDRKIMVGQRVRRLRQRHGNTQAEMAAQLGISTSYLNLIERNQRPATVQFLLRLGQTFDIDLVQFAGTDEGRVAAQLREVFSDPIFVNAKISAQDIEDIVAASPLGSEAIFELYKAYKDLAERLILGGAAADQNKDSGSDGDLFIANTSSPKEAVLDYFQAQENYFSELESLTDELGQLFLTKGIELLAELSNVLEVRHGIRVRVMPIEVMEDTLSRYDRHGRRILLSEVLDTEERVFHMARQLALLEWSDSIADNVDKSGLRDPSSKRILKESLIDYMARCLLMPYMAFQESVKDLRYDFLLLSRRFGVSLEQLCYRLSSLQKPGSKGVPLFLLQIDSSGRILHRFSVNKFHPPRFGGLCPRWNLYGLGAGSYSIFPSKVIMPNGLEFASFSIRTSSLGAFGHRSSEPTLVTIVGCEASQSRNFANADSLDFNSRPKEDGFKKACGCPMCELNNV